MVVVVLAAVRFWPTLEFSLADADGYLQHTSAIAAFDGVRTSLVYAEVAQHFRTLIPGWFPLGPVPLAIWLADPAPQTVKAVQLVFILLTFAAFGIIARRLFESTCAAIFAAVATLTIWQLRYPHDPVVGTSFVTPWLAAWVMLGYAMWLSYCKSGRVVWLVCTYAAVIAAMLTGPLAWALSPLLVVLAMLDVKRRGPAYGLLAATIVAGGIGAWSGAPHLPWDRSSYASDVVSQLFAPLPTSYRAFGHLPISGVAGLWHGKISIDDRFTEIPTIHGWQWMWSVLSAVAAVASLRKISLKMSGPTIAPALVFGLGFWLLPAVVLGPSNVWRSGMPPGQSFDIVFLQYFGVATLVTSALFRLRQGSGELARLAPTLCALSAFLLCYGNTRAEAVTLQRTAQLAVSRDLLQRAGSAGFFDTLPPQLTLAVFPSEPFANGIHSEVSDAKYAIYHFSRRRFAVVSAARLFANGGKSVWILGTSNQSGIMLSLARYAGNRGPAILTDHTFGYSVFPTIRAALETPQRGLRVRLTSLQDGFAIDARRTCGSVAVAAAFEASLPTISWGAGFYERGPYGYVPDERTSTGQRLVSRVASLTLEPSPCMPPLPLVFNASVTAAAPGSLTVSSARDRQRLAVSGVPLQLSFPVPRSRLPVRLSFVTDAPSADLDPNPFRYVRDRPRDLRLIFTAPYVSEAPLQTTQSTHVSESR